MKSISLLPSERSRRTLLAAGMLFLLAGLYALPLEGIPLLSCPLKEFTGHTCLTCGMTRSLLACLHGDVRSALENHIMGPILFAGLVVGFFLLGLEASTGKRLWPAFDAKTQRRLAAFCSILWIVYCVARWSAEFLQ